ncbi:MAG: RNA-binding protein [Candidatus Lokiarchaeota archaeon]|nr:RNA-binding protein [Candidatus Lokiarchaeota archaeon]
MDAKEKFKDVLLNKPHIILGKKGIEENEGFVQHVKTLLKSHKIVKIKILKTALHSMNISELADTIAHKTDSYLLDLRGRTIILSKTHIDVK